MSTAPYYSKGTAEKGVKRVQWSVVDADHAERVWRTVEGMVFAFSQYAPVGIFIINFDKGSEHNELVCLQLHNQSACCLYNGSAPRSMWLVHEMSLDIIADRIATLYCMSAFDVAVSAFVDGFPKPRQTFSVRLGGT